jgi:predicted ATPase
MLEFRILGPLEVHVDGRPLRLGPSQRALLGLLLLHPDEVVSGERLLEALWNELEDPSPAALRMCISRLRRRLEPSNGARVLVTRDPGYVLRLEGVSFDLAEFKRLVAQADRARSGGDLARAAACLRTALALWRGRPLADLSYRSFFDGELARLEEIRLATLEKRIDVDLALGRQSELIPELKALVAEHPLREGLRSKLMIALYRDGRQAEALATYRDARRQLLEGLGIDPSPMLRRLERAILAQDPELELGPTPHIDALPGLPVQTTPFVGRAKELDAVCDLLRREEVQTVTLTGPAGAGKSRLAVEAARRLYDELRDGVVFVSLAPIREPALVPAVIARTCGLAETAEQGAAEMLADFLRDKQLLLILDNFEHVSEVAETVSGLLVPGPKVLVTSRVRLDFDDYYDYAVPPLALPSPGRMDADTISRSEAVALFVERARAAAPGFKLAEENVADVAAICARLDGLPLAIELAAARTNLLSPRGILARLTGSLSLLTGGVPHLSPHHRTLQGALAWSYSLLAEHERALFRRLAVFAGGWTMDAAEAVSARGGPSELDVVDGIASLLDKNLIRRAEPAAGEPRFEMLETLREFAAEQLTEAGERKNTRARHACFFAALAEEGEPELRGPRQVEWLERLAAEHDNIRAALAWSAEGGDVEIGLRLAAALWRFWQVRGHLTEGRGRLERLLRRPAAGRHLKALAGAQACLGRLALFQGDYDAARVLFEESLAKQRELEDENGIAFSLANLGNVAHGEGRYEDAERLLEQGVKGFRKAGNAWGAMIVQSALGWVAWAGGNHLRARSLLEESLEAARLVGDRRAEAGALTSLATLALERGDGVQARNLLEEGVDIQRRLGDTWTLAKSVTNLGEIAFRQGDYPKAKALFVEGLEIRSRAGDRPGIRESLVHLARLAAAEEQFALAVRLLGAARTLQRTIGRHLQPDVRTDIDSELAAVRTMLGEEAFSVALAAGAEMTTEQAVASALRDRKDV